MSRQQRTASTTELIQQRGDSGTMGRQHRIASTTELIQRRGGITGWLVLAIMSSAMGMFNFGYNMGVINAPQDVIRGFFNETNVRRTGSEMPNSTLGILWSVTVAIIAIGGMFGAVLGAWWADKFGRKGGMLLNTATGLVAAGVMGFSKLATSYEMLILGRLIVGFNCGLYTGLCPIYIAEVAPDNIRGATGTINQLALTVGLFMSQVLGLDEILGTETLWPLLLALSAAPCLVQLLTLPLVPESPRYLLLAKGKKEEAIQSLMILRGVSSPSDVACEIDNIEKEQLSDNTEQMGFLQVIRTTNLYHPLLLTILVHLSQQLSGINCIVFFSTPLFVQVGLAPKMAKYATLAVGGIMVTMALVTIPLIDRVGRRTLLLTGLGGMCLMSIAFTICYHVSDTQNVDWLKMLTIVFALLIIVFFAVGPGPITWMLVPELFAQGPRSVACSIGVVTNWLATFVVGQVFMPLQTALKVLVFIPFIVFLAIFFISFFFMMPETKGRSIEEITALFENKKKMTASKQNRVENVISVVDMDQPAQPITGQYNTCCVTDSTKV